MAKSVIVGFGEGVRSDGTASKLSVEVVKTAFRLFTEGKAKDFIFAGGYGFKLKNVPRRSEAEAMKEILVAHGVNDKQIRIETQSRDTVGNAYFAKLEVMELRAGEIHLVGPLQHLWRMGIIMEMVMGPEYKINLVQSPDIITMEQLPHVIEAESLSIELAASFWKQAGIKPGEHEKIWELLRKTHPAYTDSPVISEGQQQIMQKVAQLRKLCKKFDDEPI
ncbi:MAG: YdcF family protein [Candidatus Micrarchaeota archaeon]|nr:YdcF family protein [Candidatus Micrarchaeota archaeon]MDE1848276.1 YdcF family protein [Candidatus Micrarchaeota archaeon]MDE1864587.1 YdcF family protein [Candidatus Micrarchaeota archaeon]